MQPGQSSKKTQPDNQATKLLNLLLPKIELFQDPTGISYADIPIKNHYETTLLRTRAFKEWAAHRYFSKYLRSPGGSALESALNVLCGKAGEEPKREVFLRIGHYDGKIYLDLCNSDWSVVEITSTGWKIINRSPIPFRHSKGMKSIPNPITGGNVNDLLRFIKVSSLDDFYLLVSWIFAAFSKGSLPVLVLGGEQGAGKTTVTLICRELIDPNEADLKTKPRDEKDLAISANNSYVLTFDNLSSLPDWISDALCRLSTGGGFSTRSLYTDSEESIFNAKRPIILNGITEIIHRGDLMSRAILVNLPAIDESERRSEEEFWKAFNQAKPYLLGAFLDVVTVALANLPRVSLATMPRMADFARWMAAAEPGLCWPPGAFMAAYTNNQENASSIILEDSHLAETIKKLVEKTKPKHWEGTARDLWKEVVNEAYGTPEYDSFIKQKPHQISGELRRLAPNLRAQKIDVVFNPPARNPNNNKKVERLIIIKEIVDVYQPSMVTP
jgi:hypothetical protein